MHRRAAALVVILGVATSHSSLSASGHGPMFGMTTPTNAQKGWSIDFGAMGREGDTDNASTARTMLTYGITEDFQVSGSVPLVFGSAPLPASRMTGMMPGGGDFEGIVAWRFHRQGTGVGTRFESTAYGGLLAPGPQKPAGLAGTFKRALGTYTAVATGVASRSHYVWGGVGSTRYGERDGDERPQVLSYSLVWGYRPPQWRKDYPHWDWRFFGEMTGEKSSKIVHNGAEMPGTAAHQIFLGPSVLGIYKNYAIESGIQFPVYRNLGEQVQREAFRYAVNVSYFF